MYKVYIPFLTSSIPNLSLDGFMIDKQSFSLEFDADGGLGIDIEFVSCEAG